MQVQVLSPAPKNERGGLVLASFVFGGDTDAEPALAAGEIKGLFYAFRKEMTALIYAVK